MSGGRSNFGLWLGVAAAGGVGYYLYTAGGSPRVAEKNLEADLSKASAKLKGELPGKSKEFQKKGEAWASETGQKLDNAADKARAEFAKAEGKLESYRKEAGKEATAAINKFDATVEEKAAKAKSGISSWFGGK